MRIRLAVRALLVFVSLPLLVGCRGPRSATGGPSPEALYQAAIDDARTAAPSEIVTTLTPLVPSNDNLIWRTTADSARQVLVVTWGGSETLPDAAAGGTVTASEDVWVTAAPAVRRFCRSLDRTGRALDLRLAQRLGLPPDADYTQFVELWVRPADLVRPCPDPEVSDRECERTAPVPREHVRISESHREWFRELRRTSYGPDGYPFTGLGYTYDWHPATDEVGPSEFVLRPGEPATVEARHSTAAYCRVN
jgi:hypothetical protein